MRKPNPKKQPNAGRIAQNTHKLPAELIKLAVEYLELPRYPAGHPNAGKRIGVSALEVKHKVAPGYISRSKLIERLKQLKPTDAPLLSTFEKREPKAWTPDTVELMERQAEEWGWRFSDREMADFLSDNGVDVSHVGVWRYRQENEWTEKRSQVVPWLSTGDNGHRGQRQEFAAELTDETWDAWVDGDEKWFYGLRLHEILKLPPGVEAPPPLPIKSKRFLPKVMHLCAVGRPRFGARADGQRMVLSNGKVGIWRVTATTKAKKKNQKRGLEAGDEYEKVVTITAKQYYHMVTTKVFPAIVKAYPYPQFKEVVYQHDGARPHTGEDVEARLNEFGAKLRPKIRVVRQPPNSPDTNICDLALFRALAVAVHKRLRTTSHTTLFDLERLVKDVEAAFKEYDADTLDSMWDYKTYVMEQIAIDGGNTYPRHRPQDRKRKRG